MSSLNFDGEKIVSGSLHLFCSLTKRLSAWGF